MSLHGRVAIISGATGGLGRHLARRFADEGSSLVLLGTDASRLAALASELALPADRWLTLVADLRDAEAAATAVGAAAQRFGRIDVLAQLVGGYAGGTPLVALDPGELRSMLDQHLWITFNLVRAAVPHMLAAGWGRILAVSPTSVASPGANMSAYTSAKAAQEGLLTSLARELKGSGVTANLLVVRAIDSERAGKGGGTTPELIASAIVNLCSDDAAGINGARIPLTAG
jgi:3-oxoacyl-[acyl-carrier protein] reductase